MCWLGFGEVFPKNIPYVFEIRSASASFVRWRFMSKSSILSKF